MYNDTIKNSQDLRDILILIPAYNEEKTIGSVIESLKRHGYVNILVVDDGSTDKTGEIVNGLNVYVVKHLFNSGLGSALSTGFTAARIINPEIIVTYDADAQHDPKDIKKMIEPIRRDEADIVIGSRMLVRTGMPRKRIVYNKIANFITFIIYGFSISDTQSGLRAFNRKAYNLINIDTARMECSSEIIYKIKRTGLRFKEVKVKPIYTDYSLSKGQGLGVGIKTLIELILDRLTRR